jgi:hypothetical protein
MKIQYLSLCVISLVMFACRPSVKEHAKRDPKPVAKAKGVIKEEDIVVNLIMNLDEVKHKSAQVVKESNGRRHLSTYIEMRPTVTYPYYSVKVAEDNGSSYVAYYSFAVYSKTHEIAYYDVIRDSLISISQWRNTTLAEER